MSIRPEGGWEVAPRNESVRDSTSLTPSDVRNIERTSSRYMGCKVCDVGTLGRKSVFRMSGPTVVIGFILLIPSIVGIVLSGLLLVGVLSVDGNNTHASATNTQSSYDYNFRRNCARQFKSSRQAAGLATPQFMAEQYCECALSEYKSTSSAIVSAQTCSERENNGELASPTNAIDALYLNRNVETATPDTSLGLFRFLGSVSAITLGIMSFVGGLLGWLLVMKKRILQCDTCEAVINAS